MEKVKVKVDDEQVENIYKVAEQVVRKAGNVIKVKELNVLEKEVISV